MRSPSDRAPALGGRGAERAPPEFAAVLAAGVLDGAVAYGLVGP
ncbi:MAG TPA: hypothetical protein VGJ63_09565 [Micromonosporaceae bacterium]